MTPEMQIAETQEPATEQAPQALYELGDRTIEAVLKKGRNVMVHRLRRPTVQDLHERGQLIQYEIEDLNDEETREIYDEDPGDLRLWERIATDVQGYRVGGDFEPSAWISVSTAVPARGCELRSLIPAGHKTAAIRSYLGSVRAEVVREEDSDGFDLLGPSEIRVNLIVGKQKITHICRQPTEEEWHRYDRRVLQRTQIKGAQRPKSRFRGNITAAIELYDAILMRIEGAALDGLGWGDHMRERFVAAVDPWHKRQVIFALAADYGVQLGN